jgi:putative transposase
MYCCCYFCCTPVTIFAAFLNSVYNYSKSSISRMINYIRKEVDVWLHRGLDAIIGEKFPGAAFQRCTTHLKRGMMARVRHGDKKALADDMREVFRTGDKNYTIEQGIRAWKDMCLKWGKDYRGIRALADDEDIAFYFTYLNYAPRIQPMIYTTNWIERLQKDFRRVTRMRGAMPDEDSVIVLMGKTAMDKESYGRVIPRIREDRTLFPSETT